VNINKRKFFHQSESYTVDIVVIGRNEGELLRDAINSAIEASNYFQQMGYPRPKIIYVDGRSTDGSVDLAKSLGVDTYIVEGKPTPPAGRHLGLSKCKGEYVFFLDGDTTLYRDWLVNGIKYLEQNKRVAGVGGILDWEEWSNGEIIGMKSNYWNVRHNGEKVVDGVGGNFLYRCDIFDSIGNWQPAMSRNGEFELHLRIAHAGYSLRRIFIPMAIHRDDKTNSSKTFLQRHILTSNIFIPGVITRRAPKSLPALKLLFYRYWLYLLHPVAVLGILIFIFLYFHTLSVKWIISGIVAAIFLFITHYFYKGKNLRRAIISVITMIFFSFGWLIGLFVRWPSWDDSANISEVCHGKGVAN
jgi:glycosyltransferase involved in cell wall biosynthesis